MASGWLAAGLAAIMIAHGAACGEEHCGTLAGAEWTLTGVAAFDLRDVLLQSGAVPSRLTATSPDQSGRAVERCTIGAWKYYEPGGIPSARMFPMKCDGEVHAFLGGVAAPRIPFSQPVSGTYDGSVSAGWFASDVPDGSGDCNYKGRMTAFAEEAAIGTLAFDGMCKVPSDFYRRRRMTLELSASPESDARACPSKVIRLDLTMVLNASGVSFRRALEY